MRFLLTAAIAALSITSAAQARDNFDADQWAAELQRVEEQRKTADAKVRAALGTFCTLVDWDLTNPTHVRMRDNLTYELLGKLYEHVSGPEDKETADYIWALIDHVGDCTGSTNTAGWIALTSN